MTINRFCSSGLQSIAMAAERIMAGSTTSSSRAASSR
jgi:acetyl-CoA acetyltransferase